MLARGAGGWEVGMRGLTVMLPERQRGAESCLGLFGKRAPGPQRRRQEDGASTGVSDEQDTRTLG